MSDASFLLSHYERTIASYGEAGYAITSFEGFIADPRNLHLVLRHDCDHSLTLAVRMAALESKLGCTSTYFVRLHATGYNPFTLEGLHQLDAIQSFGHEVGLHLETGLGTALGRTEHEMTTRQLKAFRALIGTDQFGVSNHEPARTGGLAIAQSLVDDGKVAYHAYEDRFIRGMKYLSDSGGRWREGCFSEWIGQAMQLQVLVHPYWWYGKLPQENY